jgi:hypothetical protein
MHYSSFRRCSSSGIPAEPVVPVLTLRKLLHRRTKAIITILCELQLAPRDIHVMKHFGRRPEIQCARNAHSTGSG